MSRRLLVAIILVSVAVALLVVAKMGEPPNIENDPPKPTISPAAACATDRSSVECSAACGGLAGRIRWPFDETERKALEQQYQQDCSQFGPSYGSSSVP